MCACEPGFTCSRCRVPDDLTFEDRERDEQDRYDALSVPIAAEGDDGV